MKKIYTLIIILLICSASFSQPVCNPSGNLMMFTNYDGGTLNINVDVNIPNLVIGVVAYEGTTITISGTYANNVTAVAYAGYNGSNAHCGSVINTSISGTSGSSTNTVTLIPAATLANPNGYGLIICGYSCSTTTYQDGCNTVDQIEAYFLNQFPGSTTYAHKVQYSCWSGTQDVSAGGTCCGLTTEIASLSAQKEINIYPNPASENLFIESQQTIKNVKCLNTLGQFFDMTIASGSIDISALPKGVYFLNITTVDGKTVMKKFMKK
ncbi:MAG: T9SS type A sorting domain-containing protein [Bacteroidia bacterium]